ncbi:MAG TPA: hypothetical protein PK156_18125 [Polyangium sp.]|nr:hypothetical protein [Polyangium sp.]
MNKRQGRFALGVLALVSAACATLADAETGGENLPSAGGGPFRALSKDEVGAGRTGPNVLVDDKTFPRNATVIDADGDPSTPEVFGYFAMTPKPATGDPNPLAKAREIVRYRAIDGRSFADASETVLTIEAPWEGAFIDSPSAVRVGQEVFLYYTAEGGIGLARSTDGVTFLREPGPVLGPESSNWEAGKMPSSPGVVRLDDGSFLMFYDVAGDAENSRRIGEAHSADGISWTRVGNAAVLEPQVDVDENNLFFDGVAVEAPYPVLAKSSEGRSMLRVYYAALDAHGRRAIGLAARFEATSGALERSIGQVFGGSLRPGEPCVLVRPGYSLLFVTQFEGSFKSQQIPAIAAGLSPIDAVLSAPSE